jgi:hypothetical protein
MSVSWVAGTTSAYVASGTTVSGTIPTVEDDDLLLAVYYGRSAITTPSGWGLVATCACTNMPTGSVVQTLAVFARRAEAADSGATLTITQASSNRAGLTIAAARASVDRVQIAVAGTAYASDTSATTHTPAVVTALGDGELAILAATDIVANTSGATTLTPPGGSTLWSGSALEQNRLGGAHWALNTGQSTGGNWQTSIDSVGGGWASISLRLFDAELSGFVAEHGVLAAPPIARGLAVAPVYGPASDSGILGTTGAQGVLASSGGWASAAGPLGPEQVLGASSVGWASTAGPLGVPQALGWSDFSSQITGPSRYVCDLTGGAADLRVSISSWQATLQSDRQQYLQVVVPGVGAYASEITARAAAGGEIVVTRLATTRGGAEIAYEMARGPIQTVRLDRGATNYTATLSGYGGVAEADWASAQVITLQGVRSTSVQSTMRARAAIDWLLRPGMTVSAAGVTFAADYISLYVTPADSYMDVGERAV